MMIEQNFIKITVLPRCWRVIVNSYQVSDTNFINMIYFINYRISNGNVELEHFPTEKMISQPLTKIL